MTYDHDKRVKKLAKELFKWCDDYEDTGIGLNAFEEDARYVLYSSDTVYSGKEIAERLQDLCGYSTDPELISICEKVLK